MSGPRTIDVEVRPAHAHGGGHDPHGFTIRTNIGSLDRCDLPAAFGALGAAAGLDPLALELAVRPPPGPYDPRFPELRTLLQAARRDWQLYGDGLISEVRRLYDDGRLFPFEDAALDELERLFADHRVTLRLRFAGVLPDPATQARVIERALVPRLPVAMATEGLLEVAFRTGRRFDAIRAIAEAEATASATGAPPPTPTLEEVVARAAQVELTPRAESSLAYVRQRGAVFMRRPAAMMEAEIERVIVQQNRVPTRELDPAELAAVRGATERAIVRGEGWRTLSRDLHDAVEGMPSLVNDMDRLARTELADAHAWGAFTQLREQADAAGLRGVKVWKMAQAMACDDCLRIWGRPGTPKVHDLDEVEAWSMAGGNFRKARREWRATIGPTHPNCTEGPLMLYDPLVADAVASTMARFRRTEGR